MNFKPLMPAPNDRATPCVGSVFAYRIDRHKDEQPHLKFSISKEVANKLRIQKGSLCYLLADREGGIARLQPVLAPRREARRCLVNKAGGRLHWRIAWTGPVAEVFPDDVTELQELEILEANVENGVTFTLPVAANGKGAGHA